jgi:hypothetical protein
MDPFPAGNDGPGKDRPTGEHVGEDPAEEIETAEPECKTTEILIEPKKHTARLANRRRRIRVYLPG